MSLWSLLVMVIIVGSIGGLVNSLIIEKGFELPRVVKQHDGSNLLVPGFIGNILSGAVAAGGSWFLYGPLSQMMISTNVETVTMPLATLGGALLVGMSGSGWLTNAVGKSLLQSAAVHAASAPASAAAAQKIAVASPLEALNVAQQMQGSVAGAPG